MNTKIYGSIDVKIGIAAAGVHIWGAVEEAKARGLDYLIFNRVLIPVNEPLKDDYLRAYPQVPELHARLQDRLLREPYGTLGVSLASPAPTTGEGETP